MNQTQVLPILSPPIARPQLIAADSSMEIAGYQLLERIGVGGFGEVWRVKLVKIIII